MTLLTFSINGQYRFKDVASEVVWVKKDDAYNYIGLEFTSNEVHNKMRDAMRHLITL